MHLKKMKKTRLRMLMEIKKRLIFYEDKFGQACKNDDHTHAVYLAVRDPR
jgi:hypothetical protein